jgi:hypothetical protein
MNDRKNLLDQLADLLGDGADDEIVDRVYETLRADDRIYYDDLHGLTLRDDVDVMAVAEQILADRRAASRL